MRRPILVAALAAALLAPAAACTLVLGIEDLSERPPGNLAVSADKVELISACGAEPTAKTITLVNSGEGEVSFRAVLASGSGSAFSVSPESGTLTGKSQQVLTLRAKPLAPGAKEVSDSLLVEATAIDAGATVSLVETPSAPVLVIQPSSVDFTAVLVGKAGDAGVTIQNTGNGPASLSLASDAGFVFTPSQVDVEADASVTVGVQFVPQAFGDATATLTLNASCNGGTPLSLHGYGAGAATKVSAGSLHVCALFGEGKVACWGAVQVGDDPNPSAPAIVPGIDDAIDVACGGGTTCIARKSGKVFCWGANETGQVGTGAPFDAGPLQDVTQPTEVVGLDHAVKVALGKSSYALLDDGTVVAWGDNTAEQLGAGLTDLQSSVPLPVLDASGKPLAGVVDIQSRNRAVLALLSDRTAVCWGQNNGKVCSKDDVSHVPRPIPVLDGPGGQPLTDLRSIGGGAFFACVVQGDAGRLLCWGDPNDGVVGDGEMDPTGSLPPVLTAFEVGYGFGQARPGAEHVCAAAAQGGVSCWGHGDRGQLGLGTFDSHATPHSLVLYDRLPSLASGNYFTCAATIGGKVVCWGRNAQGQIGVGYVSGADAGPDAADSELSIPSIQEVIGF
jgi:alpha-tubulin suppressor-like RCC1 family protein